MSGKAKREVLKAISKKKSPAPSRVSWGGWERGPDGKVVCTVCGGRITLGGSSFHSHAHGSQHAACAARVTVTVAGNT